jgi:hypothetical protein
MRQGGGGEVTSAAVDSKQPMNRQAKSNGLMAANVAIRIGYGFGGLLAPAAMAKLRLAPDIDDRPEARLFVRGFSAHQIGVATLGLASWRWQGLRRPAAAAAVAIDAADVLSAVAEAIDRRRLDQDLVGGVIFSTAGALSAAVALR